MKTLDELRNDGNWACVFADEGNWSSGNCSKDTEAIGQCSAEPLPTRQDVAVILALRDGENEGPDWIGVFELADRRFLFARGGCDYTGWD